MSNAQPPQEIQRLMRVFNPFDYHSNPTTNIPTNLITAIDSAQDDIESYEAQITDALALARSLKEKKAWTVRYAEACKTFSRNAPSPFRKLPTEIVSQILVILLHQSIDLHERSLNYGGHPQVDSLILSQVCVEWRDIVRSTPSRTSCIHITNEAEYLDEGACSMISRVLSMSGDFNALSVELTSGRTEQLSDVGHNSLSHCLAPHLRRIRSLSISGCPWILNFTLQNTFASLHSLKLDWPDCDENTSQTLDLAKTAPNLRSLDITGDPTWLSPDWANITTLSFTSSTVPYVVQISKLCKAKLESLHMHSCVSPPHLVPPKISQALNIKIEAITVFDRLTTFCAKYNHTSCMNYIQCRIRMPTLTQFDFATQSSNDFDLSPFISQFAYSLTRLKLVYLYAYPSIKRLENVIGSFL